MEKILLLIFILISSLSTAQVQHRVRDFSPDYYGIVYVTDDTSDYFFEGWISIYEKNTNKELIKVESSVIHFDSLNEEIQAGMFDTSFSDEYFIYYDDFNFDGVKDFAIADTHEGSYGTHTYRIYLAEGDKFVFNEKFSELGSEYMGMFYIQTGKKIIQAYNKSGCCYHEFYEFTVKNNTPVMISKVTEDATKDAKYVYIKTERLINGKWVKKERKELIEDYYK